MFTSKVPLYPRRAVAGGERVAAKYRLFVALICALAVVLLYLTINIKASWEFTFQFRGKKLLTFLIVAFCVSTATLIFQTLSNNRIITPAIMGFDAMYILIQTALVFVFGAAEYSQMNIYLKWVIEITVLMISASYIFQWLFVKKHFDLYLLILIGVICGILFRSVSALMMRLISPTEFSVLQDAMFASFTAVDSQLLIISAVVISLVIVCCWRYHHLLDVMALGKPVAINLGVDYAKLSRIAIIIVTCLIGLSTALVGPVTFFGLLVVNLAYIISGSHQHRYLIPMSILLAIICLVGSDILLQHYFKYNTRLSIIIEFFGGVFFILLVLRKRFL